MANGGRLAPSARDDRRITLTDSSRSRAAPRRPLHLSSRLNHPDPACVPTDLPPRPCDLGINLYSSADLYRWKFESQVVAAVNSSENGLDLERPKVVRCSGTGRYVMWLRGTPIYNGTQLKVGVLTAPTPRGPWRW
jgi:hypothetical protein